MPTGAELFVDAAQRLGINEFFTLVGDHLNEVLRVAADRGVRVIDFRHESGAAHAADAWARIHRKPALAIVTGGPGHTNAMTGLATAHLAASPLILISGAPAASMAGRQLFQVIDQVGMAAPVAKYAAQPASPGQIPFHLGRAYAESMAGRRGTAHLTIPVDLFVAEAAQPLRMPEPYAAPAAVPADSEIDRALELIRNAARPIVIAGSGVWWAGAEQEFSEFLKRSGLPFYTITMARGIVSDLEPYSMGYADPALNKAVHVAFQEADVVLVLGKRIDYRLALGGPRLFRPEAKFIQVDIHPAELGLNRHLEAGICAHLKQTLRALCDRLGERGWEPRTEWIDRQRKLVSAWRDDLRNTAADASTPLHPAAFYREFERAVPEGTLFSWDGGDFAHWGRAFLPAVTPGGWLRLGPLGTIGSALPNSIALQMANPDRPVAMITGDGSLGFYIAELDTIVRYNLPIVIVVGNDAGWGLERELQSEFYPDRETVGCELRRTRYDLVMKGFGGEGDNIERIEDVRPAVERAFASRRPYLLNVNVQGTRSPFTEWQIAGKKR